MNGLLLRGYMNLKDQASWLYQDTKLKVMVGFNMCSSQTH